MKGYTIGPCPSKLLERKWAKRDKDIHKAKLRNIKSSIREQYQSKQFTGNHLNRNGKKEALMERKYEFLTVTERYTEIERENRILLEKMSNIM